MFDSHVHSHHSHDSKQSVEEICQAAIEKGLKGVAVTDHVDMWFLEERFTVREIKKCIENVRVMKEKYRDQIKLLQGIEIAETDYEENVAKEILEFTDYDVVIGSVHCVEFEDYRDGYSVYPFGAPTSDARILAFLKLYFDRLRTMVDKMDFDVLAHLNCPLRYINGKYKRGIDDKLFSEQIDAILLAIIQKGVALEINTSGVGDYYGDWLPGEWIVARYYALGGRLVTIGSDAHAGAMIGNAFEATKEMLRRIGFSEYHYYEKRKPIAVGL